MIKHYTRFIVISD